MYFHALATDYDGTVAHNGVMDEPIVASLKDLKASGRRLVMVTGRELPDLERVCPHLDLFDLLVVENGAYLYQPSTKSGRALALAPPEAFVNALRARKVQPLSVGQSIVATWEPNETVVLDVIRELGLDLQIIFNKGAVMVLPSGINKASGLAAAVEDLDLSPHNVVAVGDAENDLAFMRSSGCAVAVNNALTAVKDACDLVMTGDRGVGVTQLVERLLTDEGSVRAAARHRHGVLVGKTVDGREVFLRPDDAPVLITGTSGGGKSTLATALMERLIDLAFQLCVCDPEGDYAELDGAVVFGDAKTPVRIEAACDALAEPRTSAVVNMLGVALNDRPKLFQQLLLGVATLRDRTGRPHWMFVDEAHHMLPASLDLSAGSPIEHAPTLCFITVHPETLAKPVLHSIKTVLSIGETAGDVVAAFCDATGRPAPEIQGLIPKVGEALLWTCAGTASPIVVAVEKARQARHRHVRKYAEGELGLDRSFFFRGPNGALNLRAQNLMLFLQLADGVDDPTFVHHLNQGDYSNWFQTAIKDRELAEEVAALERSDSISTAETRARLRTAVERRYTAPADGAG